MARRPPLGPVPQHQPDQVGRPMLGGRPPAGGPDWMPRPSPLDHPADIAQDLGAPAETVDLIRRIADLEADQVIDVGPGSILYLDPGERISLVEPSDHVPR